MTGEMIQLDDLFCAIKEIELPKGLRGQVRALSDGEIKERRRYAILHSLEATREIQDESSDAYRLTIAPLKQERQKDTLIEVVIQVRRIEAMRDAILFIQNEMVPMPDDATDVQEREVLLQRETQEQGVRDAREAFVAKRLTDLRTKYKRLTVNQLRRMAESAVVGVYEQAASIDAVRWYTVYAGVYVHKDDTVKRLYQSPEAASRSPEVVVMRLFNEVEEINAVDPWEIAKNA